MCSSRTPMLEDENHGRVHRTPVSWRRVLSWAFANVLHLCPLSPGLGSKPFNINKRGLQGFPVRASNYDSKYSACSYHRMGSGSQQSAHLACLPRIPLPLTCTAGLQTAQCHCKHEQQVYLAYLSCSHPGWGSCLFAYVICCNSLRNHLTTNMAAT